MLRASSCTIVFPGGNKLHRKKVFIDQHNFMIVKERRTGEVVYEAQVISVLRTARNKWTVTTDDGDVLVSRAGCNCGG